MNLVLGLVDRRPWIIALVMALFVCCAFVLILRDERRLDAQRMRTPRPALTREQQEEDARRRNQEMIDDWYVQHLLQQSIDSGTSK
jgi:hypothetical protein